MERLIRNKKLYLLDDGTLNYNGTGIKDKKELLIQKTLKKAKLEDFTNPRLSIVGRIILNRMNPELSPKDFFINKLGMRAHAGLELYHSRCIRPTTATMLAFCRTISGDGYASLDEVQIRLAHVKRTEIDNRYAKKSPSGMPIKTYFNCSQDLFKKIPDESEPVNLTLGSTYWDVYLLRDFIRRYIEDPKINEKRKAEIWNWIIVEALEFQKISGINQAVERKAEYFE